MTGLVTLVTSYSNTKQTLTLIQPASKWMHWATLRHSDLFRAAIRWFPSLTSPCWLCSSSWFADDLDLSLKPWNLPVQHLPRYVLDAGGVFVSHVQDSGQTDNQRKFSQVLETVMNATQTEVQREVSSTYWSAIQREGSCGRRDFAMTRRRRSCPAVAWFHCSSRPTTNASSSFTLHSQRCLHCWLTDTMIPESNTAKVTTCHLDRKLTTLCFKKKFTLFVFTITQSDVDQF